MRVWSRRGERRRRRRRVHAQRCEQGRAAEAGGERYGRAGGGERRDRDVGAGGAGGDGHARRHAGGPGLVARQIDDGAARRRGARQRDGAGRGIAANDAGGVDRERRERRGRRRRRRPVGIDGQGRRLDHTAAGHGDRDDGLGGDLGREDVEAARDHAGRDHDAGGYLGGRRVAAGQLQDRVGGLGRRDRDPPEGAAARSDRRGRIQRQRRGRRLRRQRDLRR